MRIALRLQSFCIRETMVGSPRAPLLLLASLIVALALAVSPAAAQGPRKGRLLGGLMEADVNEEGVQEALSFAVSEFNKRSNDAYQSRVMRVVRARKQVSPPGQGAEIRGRKSGLRVGVRALCRSLAPGGRGLRAVTSPAWGPLSRRLQPFAGLASLLGRRWGHWVPRFVASCQLNDHRRRKTHT